MLHSCFAFFLSRTSQLFELSQRLRTQISKQGCRHHAKRVLYRTQGQLILGILRRLVSHHELLTVAEVAYKNFRPIPAQSGDLLYVAVANREEHQLYFQFFGEFFKGKV